MKLSNVTWQGHPIDDLDVLEKLPENLATLLRQTNGFIQYHGGLHVRGACLTPAWHSLRVAWLGDEAFYRWYPKMSVSDIPFAEDCYGNQFLLNGGKISILDGETGEIEPLELGLGGFFKSAESDPIEFLQLETLLDFQENGGSLKPGELLAIIPPFCSQEAADGVVSSPVSADERHRFLAKLAQFVRSLPDGTPFKFEVIP